MIEDVVEGDAVIQDCIDMEWRHVFFFFWASEQGLLLSVILNNTWKVSQHEFYNPLSQQYRNGAIRPPSPVPRDGWDGSHPFH